MGSVGMLQHGFRRSTVRNMERAEVRRSVAMTISEQKTENIYRGMRLWVNRTLRTPRADSSDKFATILSQSHSIRLTSFT
jgi:hypothetical protein